MAVKLAVDFRCIFGVKGCHVLLPYDPNLAERDTDV